MIKDTADTIMSRARTRLVSSHPFFGNASMKLKLIEDSSIDTMCTDGKVIRYNPDFVEDQIMLHNVGVLAHEVMHVTNGHMLRRGTRNHKLFNVACDYAINPILVKGGFELPEGVLLDDAYENMSAEEIYNILIDQYEDQEDDDDSGSGNSPEGQPDTSDSDDSGSGSGSDSDEESDEDSDGSGSGSGNPLDDWVQDTFGDQIGEVEDQKNADGSELNESEKQREIQDLNVSNAQSEMRAKSYGRGGGGFATELKGSQEEGTDWETLLLSICQDSISEEFTYNRPNRRYIAEDIYMPSRDKSDVRCAVIGLDTSYSVENKMLNLFKGGLTRIFEDVGFDKIYVIDFTDRVERVTEYDRGDEFDMSDRFGGGTHFASVTDWIEEEGINPSCLIYLTDGYGRAPIQPDYPVVWCLPPDADDYTLRSSGIDKYENVILLSKVA
jgi:predicted metal-dependent peptidase|tara:strand:+ start:2328 stop:3647 length:1320 start_codon:yes stop_codon:yes gene_type:complete